MSPASSEKLSTFARIKMPNIILCTYKAIRMTCCMIHNVYCIPGYLLLNTLLLPLYYLSIDTYSHIENLLYDALLYIVGWWSYGGGLIVHEHGDDIHQLLIGILLFFVCHKIINVFFFFFFVFSNKTQTIQMLVYYWLQIINQRPMYH